MALMGRFMVILVILSAVYVAASPSCGQINQSWGYFKAKYRKEYNPREDARRKAMFLANSKIIEEHNKYRNRTFCMKLTEFADWYPEELKMLCGTLPERSPSLRVTRNTKNSNPTARRRVRAPESVDWRSSGIVSDVMNQGKCGSCWAIAAIGALEGQYALKTRNRVVQLSPQHLVDCTNVGSGYGNSGCDGGTKGEAYRFIKENKGVLKEHAYPYKDEDGTCPQRRPMSLVAQISGYEYLEGDEEELKEKVHDVGPIAIAVELNEEAIRTLSLYGDGGTGVYECPRNRPNDQIQHHSMLVVGYGTTDGGQPYWLIKNSWGTEWGERGYMKLYRGRSECGIASRSPPIYPIMSGATRL